MTLLISSLTMGLILSLLALGVLFSFRIVAFRDLTVDGSITLGGTVAATLLVAHCDPWLATLAGSGAGAIAGSITGLLATRFRINGLLAGILVMTALYSVNLRVMGRSNLPLLSQRTVFTQAQQGAVSGRRWAIGRWEISSQDVFAASLSAGVILVVGATAFAFLRSNLGLAMCATGDNPDMIRALGVNVGRMTTLGLAVSNGLVACSGALLAQYQGFADVQMGIGMVVWGFASVIIGESLVGSRQVGWLIIGAVMGSILFRLLVAIALRWGLNPNDLKLITAVFVFAALILPGGIAAAKARLTPSRVSWSPGFSRRTSPSTDTPPAAPPPKGGTPTASTGTGSAGTNLN